jgi:chromosomal replication initiator protein
MTDGNAARAADKLSLFRETLLRNYGEATFKTWFSDLMIDDVSGGCVVISTESELRRDRLDQQYKHGLINAARHVYADVSRLLVIMRYVLRESSARVNALAPAVAEAGGGARPPRRLGVIAGGFDGQPAKTPHPEFSAPRLEDLATRLDPRMTFDAFAVDASNDVAVAAVRQIFDDAAPRELIYIYGPQGVGKSHLMQAAGNEWMKRYPKGRCLYLTHNNVQNGCVQALMSSSTMALQRDILSNDLVMIDDIHLLAGKQKTMREVVNLMTAITSAGRQLIVAGELAPGALEKAEILGRLADRLAGGLAVGIAPGGEALRRAVLIKARDSADLRCTITDEAIDLVVRLFSASMRECIGAYKQLALIFREKPVTVGPAEALAALQSRLGDRKRTATLDEALAAAASAFGLSVEEIKGRTQPQRIVRARHAFVYVARTSMSESYPRIGRALGRDHTTAMSSMQRAEALISRDKGFAAAVQAIRIEIGAELPFEARLAAKS